MSNPAEETAGQPRRVPILAKPEGGYEEAGKMTQIYYILEGRETRPAANLQEWTNWFDGETQVAKDTQEEVQISTVFLGLDHSFTGGIPMLFETLVFGGKHDGEMKRYSTWRAAESGHWDMCRKVFGKDYIGGGRDERVRTKYGL